MKIPIAASYYRKTCSNVPKAKAETNIIINNNHKFFLLCFAFKSTINPRPALTDNPAINEPKDNAPSANNCAKITLAAQLGIKPTNSASKG